MHVKTSIVALLTVAALGLVAVSADAQVRSAEEKVSGLRDPKRPQWASANYKLQVKLVNGRTIIGVAKNGRLFERIVLQVAKPSEFEKKLERKYNIKASRGMSQRFVDSKSDRPDVGLRLWHHDATGGYIFLLYRDIVSVKRLRIITPAELRELDERAKAKKAEAKSKIQEKWLAYRKKQREALQARLAKRNAEKAGKDGKGKDGKAGDAAKGENALADDELKKLFDRFHPTKGWTPGRKRVIEWRQWSVGAFPTAEEKDWLNNFSQWKKAYDKWANANGGGEKGGAEKSGQPAGDQKPASGEPGAEDPNAKPETESPAPKR